MSEPTPASTLRCPSCGATAAEDAGSCTYCGANLAVVGCPSCFAHLFAGMRYCPKCGTEVAREEEGASEFGCPDGHGVLTKVRVGILTFGECGDCRGLWVDAEQFGRLIDDQESRSTMLRWHASSRASLVGEAPQAIKYRPCPRCTKLMNRVNFARVSKVIVDVCKSHGTWFDRDELARVVTFVQEGGLERAHEHDVDRAVEERRRQAEQVRFIASLEQGTPKHLHGSTGHGDDPLDSALGRLLGRFLR
jgi:Zn-finger nucleic acid-binding protein